MGWWLSSLLACIGHRLVVQFESLPINRGLSHGGKTEIIDLADKAPGISPPALILLDVNAASAAPILKASAIELDNDSVIAII